VTPVALEAARQTETQQRARFQSGLATVVDVTAAEAALAQAESQDAIARLNVWRALAALAGPAVSTAQMEHMHGPDDQAAATVPILFAAFGTPRVDGNPAADAFRSWVGTGGVGGAAAQLGYLLTPDRTGRFRPAQPTDGRVLPVLATTRVAAEAGPRGIIPLQIEGEQVAGRIVGVISRFPSVVGDAVVAGSPVASSQVSRPLGVQNPDSITRRHRGTRG